MDIGTVQSVDINEQMRSAYLDYAMSVIVARALPDARDGLKPVHRRILYAMQDMGIRSNTPYRKSARIVGEVLGKYHPHGDQSVYMAMARMAQDFSMRYTLVDGQGNFGSVDGDSPAAMRYTEARMGKMAEDMLIDIDKDTVDFVDNFDGSLQEPAVLPTRLPTLLLNGSEGIAVGMATNIPPHNLRELSQAIIHVIDHYDNYEEITVEDLMKFVPGPDFPTGAMIIGRDGIRQAYSTGKGRVIMRGRANIEELRGGKNAIIFTEIPYQVNKANLIERIAELARSGRIDSISDLRDESDRSGMSIVIELKRGAQPRRVLNQLYKHTPLQSTFGINMLALIDNEPRRLSLRRALKVYVDHRLDVITRRSQFELEKARHRAHILEGLLIAIANLDEVIETIRRSDDADHARTRLIERFELTEIQAQAILDMQLRRLSALEREKIDTEHKEVLERIDYLEDLIAHPKKILLLIREELEEISEKYGDDRRTEIVSGELEELKEEDMVPDRPTLISISQRGYIKRVSPNVYRTRGRGSRGVTGQQVREEDEMVILLHARTVHTVLFFSDRGKVYAKKAFQVPDAGRTGRGTSIMNVLPLEADERITAAVAVPDFKKAEYCTMATLKGKIKRVDLSEFESVRPSGLIAMGLNDDDYLGWVRLTSGSDELVLVTARGRALRFNEQDIRPMGRPARGVTGIQLKPKDFVTALEVVEPDGALLVVTENGFGKRTPLEEYVVKGRAGMGVYTTDYKSLKKIGLICDARVVQPGDEITLMSSGGIVLRLNVDTIRICGRATRGVHLMDVVEGQTVASLARISKRDEEQVELDAEEEARKEADLEMVQTESIIPIEDDDLDDSHLMDEELPDED
jgi:DNA gyrase subunit A